MTLSRADARQRGGRDPGFEQEVADGVGALLAQFLVEFFPARRVGVAADLHKATGTLPLQGQQHLRQDLEPCLVPFRQRGAVQRKAVQQLGTEEPLGQAQRGTGASASGWRRTIT